MRSDMARVTIERPRFGSRAGKQTRRRARHRRAAMDADDLSSFEPMRSKRDSNDFPKELSDNLAPIGKFLLSKIGQRWNDVHSEMCASMKRNSLATIHVMGHVDQMVETAPMFIDGAPHRPSRYGAPSPITSRNNADYFGLYVDQSGILRLAPYRPRFKKSRHFAGAAYDVQDLRKINGKIYAMFRLSGYGANMTAEWREAVLASMPPQYQWGRRTVSNNPPARTPDGQLMAGASYYDDGPTDALFMREVGLVKRDRAIKLYGKLGFYTAWTRTLSLAEAAALRLPHHHGRQS